MYTLPKIKELVTGLDNHVIALRYGSGNLADDARSILQWLRYLKNVSDNFKFVQVYVENDKLHIHYSNTTIKPDKEGNGSIPLDEFYRCFLLPQVEILCRAYKRQLLYMDRATAA